MHKRKYVVENYRGGIQITKAVVICLDGIFFPFLKMLLSKNCVLYMEGIYIDNDNREKKSRSR